MRQDKDMAIAVMLRRLETYVKSPLIFGHHDLGVSYVVNPVLLVSIPSQHYGLAALHC